MRQPRPRWGQIAIALALVILVTASVPATLRADSQTAALKDTLTLVINVMKQWHKDGNAIDERQLVEAAIKGAVSAMGDPYTNYFSPQEYTDFLQSLEGTFTGVGMFLEIDDKYIVVTAPVKNSPASEAGILSGDRILEADGVNLVGEPIEKAVKLIRGPAGSSVTLRLERPSEGRVFPVTLTRRLITIPSVDEKMLDDQYGYIELSQFSSDAPTQFFAAVRRLESAGAKGYIIDLRNNPGGYLDAAIRISQAFVGTNIPIVVTVGKGGTSSTTSGWTDDNVIKKPMVMLVNNGSASASEIVAGVFQDYKIGPLVGTKTFGKGTVQQILGLDGGHGLKVTIQEYLTAKRRKVHGVGLTPDVVVEPYLADTERAGALETNMFITYGEVSVRVQRVQYRLNDLGFAIGDEGGAYHLRMRNKVHEFQRHHGLEVSDVIDKPFLEVLNAEVAKATAKATQNDLQLEKAKEMLQKEIKDRLPVHSTN